MIIKTVLSIARGRQCYLHQSLSSQCRDIYNKSPLQSLSVSLHLLTAALDAAHRYILLSNTLKLTFGVNLVNSTF